MENFFKYLHPGDEEKKWGLYLNVIGTSKVEPLQEYPLKEHPSGYYFTWKKGRVLQEYQIVFIIEGEGVLETKDEIINLKPGMMILNHPGVWHRYRPIKEIGWTELYLGFSGELANRLLSNEFLANHKPYINCDFQDSILQSYSDIINLVKKEKPGYQLIASGHVISIIGTIISQIRNKSFSGHKIENTIQKAKFLIQQGSESNIDFIEMASSLNVSYSYFRKMFKKYTGNSPRQYHLQLKILLAKELIVSTNRSLKDIAYSTGFESVYYFSRIFKTKTGIAPSELRK